MFASSRFPAAAPTRAGVAAGASAAGEGRESEASGVASAALLWREGRPTVWFLLLAAACLCVLVEALALRFG